MRSLLLLLPLVASAPGCALFDSSRHDPDLPTLDRDTASLWIEASEIDLANGNTEDALDRLIDLSKFDDLSAEDNARATLLTEDAAYAHLAELANDGADGNEFEDLFAEDELPKRVRVSAGVAAARARFLAGEPLEAYETLRKLEITFPTHHERAAAGALMAEIGFALADSDENYLVFFAYRDRAAGVLEYLVLNYPSERSCEDAYLTLGRLYEEEREWGLAQERYEDLILYYPGSRYVPAAEARIPALRLQQVAGPEYDRAELQRAQRELELWLERHPDDVLQPEVLATLADCERLLIDSDLSMAAYYERIDEEFGVRLHADRARRSAELLGDGSRVERAQAMLARLPEESL